MSDQTRQRQDVGGILIEFLRKQGQVLISNNLSELSRILNCQNSSLSYAFHRFRKKGIVIEDFGDGFRLNPRYETGDDWRKVSSKKMPKTESGNPRQSLSIEDIQKQAERQTKFASTISNVCQNIKNEQANKDLANIQYEEDLEMLKSAHEEKIADIDVKLTSLDARLTRLLAGDEEAFDDRPEHEKAFADHLRKQRYLPRQTVRVVIDNKAGAVVATPAEAGLAKA